jgi:glycosyltransferase involved in cell wall biosynthesis
LRTLRTPPSDAVDVAVLGTMDYGPNVEGAVWFVREVWPVIRAQHPESRLRLVGRNPTRPIRDLASADVTVTGEVADVAVACEGVRVGVVPLLSGMGIKNKTLDFMSMGLPVVTTSLGAEGIAAGPDDGLETVPADPNRLAAAIVRMLDDPGLASARGSAARSYVVHHHSWAAIGATYSDTLATLAGAGPRRTG